MKCCACQCVSVKVEEKSFSRLFMSSQSSKAPSLVPSHTEKHFPATFGQLTLERGTIGCIRTLSQTDLRPGGILFQLSEQAI